MAVAAGAGRRFPLPIRQGIRPLELDRFGSAELVGDGGFYETVGDAVEAFRREADHGRRD